MGVLDELREQAESLRSEQEREQQRIRALEQFYREELNPKMIRIYRYLKELAEHLNYIQPVVDVAYEFPGYGLVEGFRQSRYGVRTDNEIQMTEIDFQCLCRHEGNLRLRVESEENVKRLKDFLTENEIEYHLRNEQDDRFRIRAGNFVINHQVLVAFLLRADIEKSCIRLTLVNFPGIGVKHEIINPRYVDDAFLDEFGNFILRRENQFLKLQISEEERRRIRERLEADNKKRRKEMRKAAIKPQDVCRDRPKRGWLAWLGLEGKKKSKALITESEDRR